MVAVDDEIVSDELKKALEEGLDFVPEFMEEIKRITMSDNTETTTEEETFTDEDFLF